MTKKTDKKTGSSSLAPMGYKDALEFTIDCLHSGRTPYLEGQPGIGKSTIARDVAKRLKLKGVKVITPTMHNALDLRGFGYTDPIMVKGKETGRCTRFAQSTILPNEPGWLILVDELPDCPIHEQSGFYQLLLEKSIGEYIAPEGTYVMGAGNRPQDRAAANDLSTAIRGRVCTGVVVPKMEDIYQHGMENHWHPYVLGFMKHMPQSLEGFDPKDYAGGCTPRDLEAVSRAEKSERGWPKSDVRQTALACGNLGCNYGSKYVAYREISLPDPDDVIKRPTKAKIPSQMQVMYAYSAAIAQRANAETFKNIGKFAKRLSLPDRSGLLVDSLRASADDLSEHDTWIEFYAEHQDKI